MPEPVEQLKSRASTLSEEQRAELAQFLPQSLDEPKGEGASDEWLTLAEQRMAEIRSDKIVGVPAEEVLQKLLEPRG